MRRLAGAFLALLVACNGLIGNDELTFDPVVVNPGENPDPTPDPTTKPNPPPDKPPPGPTCPGGAECERFVFVSSTIGNGNLGGIEGADFICNKRAAASTIANVRSRKFAAWISTSKSAAFERLVHGTKAYLRIDGTPIANDWIDLTDGTLAVPIDRNESGDKLAENAPGVWTGTTEKGTGLPDTCNDWTSGEQASQGAFGLTNRVRAGWSNLTGEAGHDCRDQAAVYCVER